MKTLNHYITEKFQVSKDNIRYAYYPKDRDELIECIKDKIKKEGLGTKDEPLYLNDIDTSLVKNMSYLFCATGEYEQLCPLKALSQNGYFDISDWNVSNVKNMEYMFWKSGFTGKNCDISDWDVGNVTNMKAMFYFSKFDGDISNWDISKVKNMMYMFAYSNFTGKNGDISRWNVSNVENMAAMFCGSNFKSDISNWDVKKLKNAYDIFYMCPLEKNPPKWYKEYISSRKKSI